MKTVQAYKFNRDATAGKMEIPDPAEFLKSKYVKGCTFGLAGLLVSGTYRLQGWEYNFRPWLKRYVYKQAGEWRERYAPSRGALRTVTTGRIEKILETERGGAV